MDSVLIRKLEEFETRLAALEAWREYESDKRNSAMDQKEAELAEREARLERRKK